MKSNFLFYFPLLVLFLSLIFISYFVVYKNILIKDITFSYAALVAATAMFFLNIWFSTTPKTESREIESAVLINNAVISIDKSNLGFSGSSSYITRNKSKFLESFNIPNSLKIISKEVSLKNSEAGVKYREKIIGELNKLVILTTFGIISEELPKWKAISNNQTQLLRNNNKKIKETDFITNDSLSNILNNNNIKTKGIIWKNVYKGIYIPNGTEINIKDNKITFESTNFTLDIIINFSHSYKSYKLENGKIVFTSNFKEHNFIHWPFTIEYRLKFKREKLGSPLNKDIEKWTNNIYETINNRYKIN